MQTTLLTVLLLTIVALTSAQQHAVLTTYKTGASCDPLSFESASSIMTGNTICLGPITHYFECDVSGGSIHYKQCSDDVVVASYPLETCAADGGVDILYTCVDSALHVNPAVEYTVLRTGVDCGTVESDPLFQELHSNGACVTVIDPFTLTTTSETTVVTCDDVQVTIDECAGGSPSVDDFTCKMDGTGFLQQKYECVSMGGPSDFGSGSGGFPSGSEGFPSGSEGFPSGSEGFPSGSEGFPSGSEGFPSGSEGFPSGSEGFPSGSEGFPTGGPSDGPSDFPSDMPSGMPTDEPSEPEPTGDETNDPEESSADAQESTSFTFVIDSGNYMIASLLVIVVLAFVQ